MESTTRKLTVRLSEEEYAHLKQLSDISGLKLEPVIRRLIMGKELKPRPPEEYADMLRQLSGMGNNINQIARIANTCGTVRPEEINHIREMQSAIWDKIKSI